VSDRIKIVIENRVADVRFNRVDKMNALDDEMFQAIIEAQTQLAGTPKLRAIVLSGQGRAFCAGIDLTSLATKSGDEILADGSDLILRTHGNTNLFQEVAAGWRKLAMPVVAAIHGVCFGGGLQIASGADIRITAPDTRMSIMEMKWGLVPDMGGLAHWRSYVRDDILRELTYTNREFSGEEALALGFATYVDADPHARAMAIAQQIATKSPTAIRAAKDLYNRLPDMVEDEVLMAESTEQMKLAKGPNQLESVLAGMQKRPANFID